MPGSEARVGELAVVGAGVIGLAVAWRAAAAGWSVTVHDPAPAGGASWVAGGMLAPLSEGWPGEDQVLEFGAAALARWPAFAADLGAAASAATGDVTGASAATGDVTDVFTARATLTVALDAADAADLHTIAEWVGARGHELRLLDRVGVRAAVPGLARAVRAGLWSPAEPAVDNRALLAALRRAVDAAGVRIVTEPVRDLAGLPGDRLVLAAGAASASLWPGLPVRPVKGEILRLRRRPSAPAPHSAVVRARVHGRSVYLVPRPDGMVVGATQYEAGRDTAVTVAGVRDLIADAAALLPAIGEYELAEASAGLRPMTPDNLPLIGRLSDRVLVATGNGRNGVLTTPLTADAVLAELSGGTLVEAKCADPQRFAERFGGRGERG